MSEADPQSGLYPEERKVVNLLVAAWNEFYGMDRSISPEEMDRFRAAIHQAQQVFADRALHRAYPEFWN